MYIAETKTPRRLLLPAALLALALTVALTAAAERSRRAAQAVCADTLRLHILANSDTPADQLAKLRARTAVLKELEPLLTGVTGKTEAETLVRAALPRLRRAAGQYTALRVTLGAGAGHNWFCVLYPELCIGAASAEYPTEAENELVFGRWRVRLALWDLLTARP